MKGNWIGTIVRFIVSAIVLLLVAYLLPGIKVAGFTGALIAAIVIAIIGYIVESVLVKRFTVSRGLVGFLTAAVVNLCSTVHYSNWLSVSILGALLAALVIGIVDAVVPTELR